MMLLPYTALFNAGTYIYCAYYHKYLTHLINTKKLNDKNEHSGLDIYEIVRQDEGR